MVNKRKKKSPTEKGSAPSEKCVAQSTGPDGKEGEEKGAAEAMETDGQAPASDPLLAVPTKEENDQVKKDPETVPPSGAAAQLAPQPPQPTRFSARVAQKRPRRDSSPPANPASNPNAKKAVKTEEEDNPNTKRRRQWESWSVEDKDLFFDALCEHGKDFDAIHHVLLVKNKKRGDTVTKTKEQIRHFYYRTWQKIYKHLKDIKDVKNKQAAELYGLINYGEMRKKLGPVLNGKTSEKLNELLHHGVTFIKVKGKNKRISTPVCRALKKLNNFEENKESERLKVPDKVVVELQPKTTAAWTKVQSFSQNPRLRFNLKGNKRLSSLFCFLEKKWVSVTDHLRSKALKDNEADIPVNSELRLFPPADVKLSSFTITQVETQPPIAFSLDRFIKFAQSAETNQTTKKVRQKAGASVPTEKPMSIPVYSLSSNDSKSHGTEGTNDSIKSGPITEGVGEPGNPPHISGPLLSFKGAISNDDVVAATVKLPASKDNVKIEVRSEETVASCSAGSAQDKTKSPGSEPSTSPEEDLERYRKGWTKAIAGNMTMAEVYLLFDAPAKMILEYEWTDVNEQFSFLNENLTNVLRRLVHIATTEFVDVTRSKSQPSAVPSSLACEQCGRGLGKSPRAGKNGSPATPKGGGRGRARTNSDSGSNTPKSRGSTNTVTTPKSRAGANAPSAAAQATTATSSTTDKVAEQPAVAAKVPSDGCVFRIPNAVPPARPVASASGPNQQMMQQVNNAQKQLMPNIMFPPRPRMRRQLRKPLVVQRRLLPKANTHSRQLVTFAIGQNGSLVPIVPDSDGDNGSFSQLPPPGGTIIRSPTGRTVSNKEGMRTLSLSSAAGQRVVARKLIPGPDVTGGMSDSSEKEVVRALTSAAGQRVVARKLIPDPEVVDPPKSSVLNDRTVHNTAVNSVPGLQSSTTTAGDLELASETATSTNNNVLSYTTLTPVPLVKPLGNGMPNLNNVSLSDAALPPPSISSLLDISLPSADAVHPAGSAEKFIDIALENTNASFTAFLDNSTLPDDSLTTPPKPLDTSCTSLGAENAWLNGELQDFSLSNFLGESPAKKEVPQTHGGLMCESSRDSLVSRFDVDSAFQSMMNENSLDYVAKFADLAAQISASHRKPEETL